MKTIKVIDLLAKIAKGKTLPKKIKIYDKIWEYNDTNKDYYLDVDVDDNISLLKYNLASVYSLNKEVEIIEDTPKEDKKIDTTLDNITKNVWSKKIVDMIIPELIEYAKKRIDEEIGE